MTVFPHFRNLTSTDFRCGYLVIHSGHLGLTERKKGKVFPYSLPSVGPGADPGVQAVSPRVT